MQFPAADDLSSPSSLSAHSRPSHAVLLAHTSAFPYLNGTTLPLPPNVQPAYTPASRLLPSPPNNFHPPARGAACLRPEGDSFRAGAEGVTSYSPSRSVTQQTGGGRALGAWETRAWSGVEEGVSKVEIARRVAHYEAMRMYEVQRSGSGGAGVETSCGDLGELGAVVSGEYGVASGNSVDASGGECSAEVGRGKREEGGRKDRKTQQEKRLAKNRRSAAISRNRRKAYVEALRRFLEEEAEVMREVVEWTGEMEREKEGLLRELGVESGREPEYWREVVERAFGEAAAKGKEESRSQVDTRAFLEQDGRAKDLL